MLPNRAAFNPWVVSSISQGAHLSVRRAPPGAEMAPWATNPSLRTTARKSTPADARTHASVAHIGGDVRSTRRARPRCVGAAYVLGGRQSAAIARPSRIPHCVQTQSTSGS